MDQEKIGSFLKELRKEKRLQYFDIIGLLIEYNIIHIGEQ